MTFSELISDIEQLAGKTLRSIGPARAIRVEGVDRENERVKITTADKKSLNRTFAEIQLIWEELNSAPAVHVDSTLGGSGSSRNQPETILANLPYIEHLTFRRKKHIAYVGRATHPAGTLKEMDPVAAEATRDRLKQGVRFPVVVMVFRDLNKALSALERILGTRPEAVHQGVYKKVKDGMEILVVSRHLVPPDVGEGTYPVLRTNTPLENEMVFRVGGHELLVTVRDGVKLLVERT